MTTFYLTGIDSKKLDTTRETEMQNIQDLYLRFIINEDTMYSDIGKIEDTYIKQAIAKNSKLNYNKIILKKKEEEYNRIVLEIMNQIFDHYDVPKKSLIDYYETQITKITNEISIREHQIETYKNTFNRLYHSNYMIKRRQETEQKFFSICSEQYSKYCILKQHPLKNAKKNEKIKQKISEYEKKLTIQNGTNLYKKVDQLTQLESSVYQIKKDFVFMNCSLKSIQERISIEKKELKDAKILNEIEMKGYFSKFREFHKKNTQLLSVYSELNVNNLDDLILKFIKIKGELQAFNSVFWFENKELQKLNNKYSYLKNTLKGYHNQITKNKKLILDITENPIASAKLSRINKEKFLVKEVNDLINKKLLLFTLINSFLIQNNKKISQEIDINQFTNNSKIINLIKSNNEDLIDQLSTSNHNDLIKTAFGLLNLFGCCFFYSLFGSLKMILSKHIHSRKKKIKISIYYLYKEEYLNSLKQLSSRVTRMSETRIKIYKKNEQRILSNINKKKSATNKIICRQLLSKNKLYNSFVEHLESKNKELAQNESTCQTARIRSYLLENHPRKIMSFVEKYQNDLVIKEKPLKRKKSDIVTRNVNKLYDTTYHPLTLKKIQQKNIKDQTQSTFDKDDSYEEHYNDYLIGTKKKMIKMVDGNHEREQTAQIYKRMNDIRTLDLKYKDNNPQEISMLYSSIQNKRFKKYKTNRNISFGSSYMTFRKSKSIINENSIKNSLRKDVSFNRKINNSAMNLKSNLCPNKKCFPSRNNSLKMHNDKHHNLTLYSSSVIK